MQTKTFEGPGFCLEIPTDWFITSSMQFQAMFIAPPGDQGERANLAVSMTPVQSDANLRSVIESARETQEKEYPQYQVLEEQDSIDPEGTFRRRYQWYNPKNGVRVIQLQIFWITGQILFTITTTRTNVQGAEEFENIFDKIIDSFRLC